MLSLLQYGICYNKAALLQILKPSLGSILVFETWKLPLKTLI
jgi:hypothetical protein